MSVVVLHERQEQFSCKDLEVVITYDTGVPTEKTQKA
jgi:hypothetical protein